MIIRRQAPPTDTALAHIDLPSVLWMHLEMLIVPRLRTGVCGVIIVHTQIARTCVACMSCRVSIPVYQDETTSHVTGRQKT